MGPVRMVDASGHGATWTTEQLFVDVYEPLGWLRAVPDEDEPGDGVPLEDSVFLIPGPKGDPGEPGPPGGMSVPFLQVAPSAAWPIAHNLGRIPMVIVVIDGEQVLADVTHIDMNNASVVLAEPASGLALLA